MAKSNKTVTVGKGRSVAEHPANEDAVQGETIRVRAIAVGFYGDKRRRVGDVFDLYPRQGTFTQLVRDDKGKPELDRSGLTPSRITEEKEDHILTAEQQFNRKWMVKVSKGTRPHASTAQERINAEHDQILRARLSGNSSRPADQVSASGNTPGQVYTGDLNVLDGQGDPTGDAGDL